MNKKRLTKEEKMAENKQKREDAFGGTGIYIFENKTNSDFLLPKLTLDNKRFVGPNQTFRGDSFFFKLVKENMLKLVKVIDNGENN
jgi:hypothetical protein